MPASGTESIDSIPSSRTRFWFQMRGSSAASLTKSGSPASVAWSRRARAEVLRHLLDVLVAQPVGRRERHLLALGVEQPDRRALAVEHARRRLDEAVEHRLQVERRRRLAHALVQPADLLLAPPQPHRDGDADVGEHVARGREEEEHAADVERAGRAATARTAPRAESRPTYSSTATSVTSAGRERDVEEHALVRQQQRRDRDVEQEEDDRRALDAARQRRQRPSSPASRGRSARGRTARTAPSSPARLPRAARATSTARRCRRG